MVGVLLLATVALVCSVLPLPVSAQTKELNDLVYVLPLVIVIVVIIIITVVVIYMLYRAKRGYFCCLKPTYGAPRRRSDTPTDTEEQEESPTDTTDVALPPRYLDNTCPPVPPEISPPDYRDALQDKIVTDPESYPASSNEDNPESTIEPIPPPPTTTTTTTTTLNDPPQIIPSPAVAVNEKEEETPPTTVQEEELEDDSIESCSDTTPLNP